MGSRNYRRFCQKVIQEYRNKRLYGTGRPKWGIIGSDRLVDLKASKGDAKIARYLQWVDDFTPKHWKRRLQNAAK